MSGLTAAHELTRTPELRRRFEVTVYQMGWRLGGKLASGRNAEACDRNEEHGLHVWFGFYENAFRLAREVFEAWTPPAGCPVTTVEDFVRPHAFTPIGDRHGGEVEVWAAWFGANRSLPGTGSVGNSGRQTIGATLGLLATLLRTYGLGPAGRGEADQPDQEPGDGWSDRLADRLVAAATATLAQVADKRLSGSGRAAAEARRLAFRALSTLLRVIRRRAGSRRRSMHHLSCCIEFLVAMLGGLLDPRWSLLVDGDLDRINHLDFREWLIECGASPEVAYTWPGINALYDCSFQFLEGDRERPAFEAGTALRFFIRAYFTYKGGVLYLLEVGMGEGLIAPLYETLRERGVSFEFFHELTGVGIHDGRAHSLRFVRQATPIHGTYEPLLTIGGLRCWPSQPLWEQLHESPDPACAAELGHALETNRGTRQAGQAVHRLVDEDFDEVVLAVPAGVLTERTGPSPISELLDHQPSLRACLDTINLVPSVAAQLWVDRSLPDLGWRWPRPAMVGWAHPYDVWADMTPVLPHESWPAGDAPITTHYLCGGFQSAAMYSDDPEAYERAQRSAKAALADQLARHGPILWPGATTNATGRGGGEFDWSVLHDPDDRTGPSRLEAQYVRANVAPSDLCACAAPGTSRLRPQPHESGLDNLVLCGTWVDNAVNSSCVEAATMAGMAAARVLTGPQRAIIGEDFMRRPPDVVTRHDHDASATREVQA